MWELTSGQLYNLYESSISSVITSSMLSSLADTGCSIGAYNFINRVLIYIQNKYASNVMGADSWEVIGRSLVKKSSPIWIIDSITKTVYTDNETGETIDNVGLTLAEIDNAVRLGILSKSKEVVGIRSFPVFDVRDTEIYDNLTYKEYLRSRKSNIKLSDILNTLSNGFKVKSIPDPKGKSRFDKSNNTLSIGRDSLESKVDAAALAIFYQMSSLKSESEPVISSDIVDIAKSFSQEYLKSCIVSDYMVDESAFAKVDSLDLNDSDTLEQFMTIMIELFDLLNAFIESVIPKSTGFNDSVIRKANELLNLLEANYEYSRLRGDA